MLRIPQGRWFGPNRLQLYLESFVNFGREIGNVRKERNVPLNLPDQETHLTNVYCLLMVNMTLDVHGLLDGCLMVITQKLKVVCITWFDIINNH